jgi:ankyrin repeat protein
MTDDPGKRLLAAAAGDIEGVRRALADGAPVNRRGAFGDTALNIAADAGKADIVELLLKSGADVENLGGADKTPVMSAAFAGRIPVVRLLVAAGARITDDLLDSISLKIDILEANAENGMVREEAVENWRKFLHALVQERAKQDASKT